MCPCAERSSTAQTRRSLTQDLRGNRTRQAAQALEPQDHRAVVPDRESVKLCGGGLVERGHGLARQGRHSHERGRNLGIVGIGEKREQLVADAITEELRISVRRVLDP